MPLYLSSLILVYFSEQPPCRSIAFKKGKAKLPDLVFMDYAIAHIIIEDFKHISAVER